jgi:zinc-binding alcohol dehydrogenase/oxidoreductase
MTGGGPDVIVDGAGGETFAQALAIARPGGRIVSYGATSGSPSTIEVRRLFWKQLTLLGSTMGTPREFAGMLRLYQEGRLRPVVDCVLPLGDVAEAHRRMEAGEQFGKIVLDLEPGLQ